MKKATINTLMIFIFASQVLQIFGNVTVLRSSLLSKNATSVKLICVSEDDGGALVWNYNLIGKFNYSKNHNSEFYDDSNNNTINCKMNAIEGCLKSWTKDNWTVTNSVETPMGPVLDERWEEFKEYQFNGTSEKIVFGNANITKVTFSFSVRTTSDVHVLFCNNKDNNIKSCYIYSLMGIEADKNTRLYIYKCEKHLDRVQTNMDLKCKKLDSFTHKLLSVNEWQTFVITWDFVMQKITVYDTDKIIMTYTVEEKFLYSKNEYSIWIGSNAAILLRLHTYDFLYTTVENASLTSPIFHFNNETICVQLLIGLCAECLAYVELRDSVNYKLLKTFIAKGSPKALGLSMWQSVKIETNLTNYNNYGAIIQLIPKLNDKHSSNPLWAIANVRQCPQSGNLKRNVIEVDLNSYTRMNMTCQKLFYDEYAVVNPTSHDKSDVNLDNANCPEDKIGPQCMFSCIHDLYSNSNCQGVKVCYKDGCTCTPGYLGENCSEPCKSNTYGHNCVKTCGACLSAIHLKEWCNTVTGSCLNGCKNTEEVYYIPPLCQISVDKPNTPVVTFKNETTIWADVFMTWKNEYENISIFYSFAIIKEQTPYDVQPTWNRIFRNMTQLTRHFENLEPATTYQIRCSLLIKNIKPIQLNSDWQVVETECNPADSFDLTPEENGIIINWRINPNQLYSCPAWWYYLEVRNIYADKLVLNSLAEHFPYNLQALPSYTFFNVIIYYKDYKLFFHQIRTLEGVPSRVLELQKMLSANTQLTLIWRPPHEPNGKIVRYEVILKVKEYYGCRDLKIFKPYNHVITKSTIEPTITISDLHPYTFYSAQVIALNSRHFSTYTETIFNTTQSEIPSEIFSQLRVQDWKLSWSPPEDCTTISGSLKARIKIQGISDAVKDYNITKQTNHNFLDLNELSPKLNGVERYLATVYVIRNYSSNENASAYQKYEFETPPTAPPEVTNLEIVEIDRNETLLMIHLRWQSPRPPLNGKLRDYTVQLCESLCTNITVQLNESCNLWNDFICTIVKKSPTLSQRIKVFASNINVTEPGPPVFITDDMLNNTTPDPPANSTSTINENSVVDLEWLHPWKTGAQLKSFRIQIEQIYSNLFQSLLPKFINKTLEYPVTQYMPNYSQRLYLLPSTHYSIHVQAVTIANTFSNIKSMDVHTPSTAAFDGDLEVMINKSDYTILLKIPPVKNDTQLSKMHIIIVNRNPCDQYLEVPQNLRTLARVRTYETAWQAAEVLTSEYAGKKEFRVGDNKIYGVARNCPLKSGELYEIVIIVIEQNSDSSTKPIMLTKSVRIDREPSHYLAWLIPIILFFVVSCATFYFCRRNRHQKEIKRKIRTEHESMMETKFNEEEMKSLNLEDNLSTLSDGHTLSLVTTPEVSSMIVVHDDEKEENENKLSKGNYTHVLCNPKQYRSYSLPLEFSDSSKLLQKTSCFSSNEF